MKVDVEKEKSNTVVLPPNSKVLPAEQAEENIPSNIKIYIVFLLYYIN